VTATAEDVFAFAFTTGERDRRWGAVRRLMAERGHDCLIVQGSFGCYRDSNQNLQYLTNVNNEGFLVFPADGDPTLFSFENGLDPTWVPDWRGAIPEFGKQIVALLRERGLERADIGTVGTAGMFGELNGFPHRTHQILVDGLPDARLAEATDIVEGTRKVKSDEEVHALALGCSVMARVFDAIVETAAPGVADYEIRAVIMDTLFRNGCDPGGMILYCQGADVMHGGQSGGWLERPVRTPLRAGDVVLIELDAPVVGYKAQFNTAVVVGEVEDEWHRIFETAARCFQDGLGALRPGLTVGELDDVLLAPIDAAGFTFGNPAFHGLGLGIELPMGTYPRAHWEPDRDEVLREGMVLEFEPHPCSGERLRGASVGCPIRVTADGCEPIPAWYEPRPLAV
jgi:Xaa-Pro aminopeptidase